MKPGTIRDKLDEHTLFYDPRSKNHHMCQVAGKALCTLQAIHIALCLRRTLGSVAFEWTKALYFYTDAQGTETQQQTRTHLLHKCSECLCRMILTQAMVRRAFSRPIMGEYARHSPEEIFGRLVRGEAAEAANRTIIHAGTVFCCMGQLMTQYVPAMFFEAPYTNLQFVATHILNHAAEYPQAARMPLLLLQFQEDALV